MRPGVGMHYQASRGAVDAHQAGVPGVGRVPRAGAGERGGAGGGARGGVGPQRAQRGAPGGASSAGRAASAPTSSGSPPRSLPSTGRPSASASTTVIGHGSSLRAGASSTAAPRRSRASASSDEPAEEGHVARPPRVARRRASSGPAPAIRSGTPASRAARIAMSKPFSSTSRPAASAYVPSAARDASASDAHRVRQHGHPLARDPQLDQPLGERLADGDERVGMREQTRLLAGEPGRVDGGLRERAAAAMPHAGQRVAAVAPVAGRAVAVGHADRAHESVVVQVQYRPRSRRARRRQRAPAEQRMDVVRVDDVGTVQPHGRRDVARLDAPAQQSASRPRATGVLAVALQPRDRVAARAQQRLQLVDHALLAAGGAIAVVQQQYARMRVGVARRKQAGGVISRRFWHAAGPWRSRL